MPMPSPPSAPQSQPKTLIHPHEQCSAAFEQWSRVMEYITLHWKASSQLKSLASKPVADPNLLRLLNSAVNRPPTEGEGDHYSHQNGSRDTLSSKIVSSETCHRTLIPWMPEDKVYTPGLMGLHEEIVDFYNYMAPLQEEVYMRTEIVNRLRQVATSLWPNAEVKVYGSFDTGLYLPTSDIDVVIKCPDLEPLTALTQLEQNLIKQGDCDDVKVIRTSVPIVKFTDKSTATKVDVSINIEGALTSAEFIKKMMATYPELKYLGFVLKQFLTSRGLLESFNGGISSYCLVLLIVSYLQLHPEDRLVNNYGIQLIKFLELYGRHFNYLNCGIRVTDGGSYFRKGENSMGDKFSLLCVEDPFNADNDVGQSCFGAMKVREEFDRAFRELCDGVLPQYSHLQPPSTSLLARVLNIAPEVVAYRRFVFERYRHHCHSTAAMTSTFLLPPGGIPAYTQIQQQQQQSLNHFNPHLTSSHHQYGSSAYQPGQGQQLNFNHPPLNAVPPVALFQQQFAYQQIMAPDSFQQTTFRYNYPVLSNIIAPPVPVDGIYSNQMAQLQVQPACLEDRSDSESLSSQHSSQSSQVSQGLGKNLAGKCCNKNSSESQQDQEPVFIKSSTPLPSVEPALSASSHVATVTTSMTTHSGNQSLATTAATTVSGNKSSDGSKCSEGNSPENANRSNSSNRLDTLCEITASARHSNAQVIKSSNSHHHQHRLDRHYQSARSTAYHEEGTRTHYVQRANSTKHNNGSNKSFPHAASYSGSSPPLESSRSSHQSRHGGNRSGTNHKNQTNVSAGPATSSHLIESVPVQRGKASNNPSSHSPTSNSSTSATTQQHYHRNGPSHVGSSVWTSSHKAARKSNTYPPSSNNFSRNGFKNQKISQSSSSSSSSSSCSPTYSPATMTAR